MPKQSKRSKKQSSLLGFFQSSSPPQPTSIPNNNTHKTRANYLKSSPKKTQSRSQKYGPKAEDKGTSSDSSDVGGINFEPEIISLSDSDDDVKTSPRRGPAKKRRVKASESSSQASSSHSKSDEENIGIPVGWKWKGKAVHKRKMAVSDSESEEEPRPKRRKLVRGVRPPTPDESEDLMDEVDQERELLSSFIDPSSI